MSNPKQSVFDSGDEYSSAGGESDDLQSNDDNEQSDDEQKQSNEGQEEPSNPSTPVNNKSSSANKRRPKPGEPEIPDDYEQVSLKVMDEPFSQQVLEAGDSELWLVTIPRYQAFKNTLEGAEISYFDRGPEANGCEGQIAGNLVGFYGFRDFGPVDPRQRAAFVVKDDKGEPVLRIAKPFTRAVNLTFDAPIKISEDNKAPQRNYPSMPSRGDYKYRPIGSGTECNLGHTEAVQSSVLQKRPRAVVGAGSGAAQGMEAVPLNQSKVTSVPSTPVSSQNRERETKRVSKRKSTTPRRSKMKRPKTS